MKIDITKMPQVIPVGVQTETRVESINIDARPWMDAWPGMILSVWLTRPGESSAYPAGDVRMDGSELIWHPDGYDTAIPGNGKLEILGLTDDGMQRKLTGDGVATLIRATTLAATSEPGEAEKPWVDKVLDAATRAEDAADRAESAGGGAIDPEDIAQAVEDYLTENPVEGVTPEEVQEAVNGALKEAKESGEFDGPPGVSATHEWDGTVLTMTSASGTSSADLKGKQGDPGKTPVKGEDYWTQADQQQIVADVLSALPTWSGGAY